MYVSGSPQYRSLVEIFSYKKLLMRLKIQGVASYSINLYCNAWHKFSSFLSLPSSEFPTNKNWGMPKAASFQGCNKVLERLKNVLAKYVKCDRLLLRNICTIILIYAVNYFFFFRHGLNYLCIITRICHQQKTKIKIATTTTTRNEYGCCGGLH